MKIQQRLRLYRLPLEILKPPSGKTAAGVRRTARRQPFFCSLFYPRSYQLPASAAAHPARNRLPKLALAARKL